jgi:hypothetical protein
MLPATIPIFPLPDVVLFPGVFLPLHIFEPRYRQMVGDALDGDRVIGMTLLRPDWEDEYEGRPAVYPLGCAGLITHAERQPDGRFNIVLRGVGKFRIRDERHDAAYRVAAVDALAEAIAEPDRPLLLDLRERILARLAATGERQGLALPLAMPDEDLINTLAQYLPMAPVERQALLECDGVLSRAAVLLDLIEMQGLAAPGTWTAGGAH